MLHLLKRHPFSVSAHFDSTLVLAYALPRQELEKLLAPGLELDTFGDFGFVAVALVQTRDLRPSFLSPALGQNFFLSGYRIFSRYTSNQGRHLRGLRILRSDTNKPLMRVAGNLLTHYHYHLAKVRIEQNATRASFDIQTPRNEADLKVTAFLDQTGVLPEGSPFPDLKTARKYAGPLPYTFDYEKETGSMILIKSVRKEWNPTPVKVEVETATFFERFSTKPILANAFYLQNLPYRWEKGRREIVKQAEAQP